MLIFRIKVFVIALINTFINQQKLFIVGCSAESNSRTAKELKLNYIDIPKCCYTISISIMLKENKRKNKRSSLKKD